MKTLLTLFALLCVHTASGVNDFWLGSRYTVSLAFGVAAIPHTNAPVPERIPGPGYPAEMVSAGLYGEVIVDFTVNVSGSVTEQSVVHSSAPEFERAVVEALQKWKFKPAVDFKTSTPLPMRMRCKVLFRFDDHDEPNKALEPMPLKRRS